MRREAPGGPALAKGRPVLAGMVSGLMASTLALGGSAGATAFGPGFGAVLLAWLAATPVFWAGLTRGGQAALIAAATGCLLPALLGGPIGVAFYALAVGLPGWALAARAVKGDAPGRLALWLTGAMVLLVLALEALLVPVGGPQGLLARPEIAGLEAQAATLAPSLLPGQVHAVITGLVLTAPALMASLWGAGIVASAALAIGLAERFGEQGGLALRMAALRLPAGSGPWIGIAVGITGVAGGFFGRGSVPVAALNLAIVSMAPFALAGLGVLHALVDAVPMARPAGARLAGRMALALVYLVAPMLGWPLVAVAALGMVDGIVDVRRRLLGGKGERD